MKTTKLCFGIVVAVAPFSACVKQYSNTRDASPTTSSPTHSASQTLKPTPTNAAHTVDIALMDVSIGDETVANAEGYWFGLIPYGLSSAPMNAVITNRHEHAIGVKTATIEGTDAASFVVANIPEKIEPKTSATFTVNFVPLADATRTYTATLNLVFDGDVKFSVDLSATSGWSGNLQEGISTAGLNWDANKDAKEPRLRVYHDHLYAMWPEKIASGKYKMRVAVYKHDATPAVWQFIDGNGPTGLGTADSFDSTNAFLVKSSGKLYAFWEDFNTYSDRRLRAYVYNGDISNPAWTSIAGSGGTALNGGGAVAFNFCVGIHNDQIYVTFNQFPVNNGNLRAMLYNGNDSAPAWQYIDAGDPLDFDPAKDSVMMKLTSFNGKLYGLFNEYNGTQYQIRAKSFDGNAGNPIWTGVDGNGANGLNKDPNGNTFDHSAFTYQNNLFATWHEEFASGKYGIRVSSFNGNDAAPVWNIIDGNTLAGLNHSSSENADLPTTVIFKDKLYIGWQEKSGGINQIRLAVFNGDVSSPQWGFVDGNGSTGININTATDAINLSLCVFANKLYASWAEVDSVNNKRLIRIQAVQP